MFYFSQKSKCFLNIFFYFSNTLQEQPKSSPICYVPLVVCLPVIGRGCQKNEKRTTELNSVGVAKLIVEQIQLNDSNYIYHRTLKKDSLTNHRIFFFFNCTSFPLLKFILVVALGGAQFFCTTVDSKTLSYFVTKPFFTLYSHLSYLVKWTTTLKAQAIMEVIPIEIQTTNLVAVPIGVVVLKMIKTRGLCNKIGPVVGIFGGTYFCSGC